MTQPGRLALIGNSLPRRCGIATFTTDLQQALADSSAGPTTTIVAMNDFGHVYAYPPAVGFQVDDRRPADYERAAAWLNAGRFDAICLQHEFGIFGGEAGDYLLPLLSRLAAPVVTTLHTVLAEPTPAQRRVTEAIVEASATVVVMAEKARHLLRSVYGTPADRIEVIAHGIPDFAFVEPDGAKAKFGFTGRTVLLTFGLLSPSKGIEVMIDAMPAILRSRPDAVYVVLGATHPNLVRQQGEAYRESLQARARALGIAGHVVFLDQFVDQPTLLDYISMCDVYVTPYLNEQQMTSGTLAYSFGLGKAVVSTPYWHAQELLVDGAGILVPFGDARATGDEIARLLTDEPRRRAMRERAYAASRSMTWARIAERYMDVIAAAGRRHRLRLIDRRARTPAVLDLPALNLGHLWAMSDDVGLLQHAVHAVPDRHHGYCLDDNARALMLGGALAEPGASPPLPDALLSRFAAFVQHAWNPQLQRFRNFMSYERRWLEESGSEDSHGRGLWALGDCARNDPNRSRRRWAAALFVEAAPVVEHFRSPRAWAFTLLGLDALAGAGGAPTAQLRAAQLQAPQLQALLAERLVALLMQVQRRDWTWFEEELAYDNARLPQALIVTASALGATAWLECGLRSLRWLMALQRTPAGLFRPVGTESFGVRRMPPRAFDQQPVDAAAAVSACRAAWLATGDARWRRDALRAFGWFLGGNDLGAALVDPESGSCRDGLHRDRPNENRGGESLVSYLLSWADARRLVRRQSDDRSRVAPVRVASGA
jgi:glycosyltransferase involved in cell wall biosynthesis